MNSQFELTATKHKLEALDYNLVSANPPVIETKINDHAESNVVEDLPVGSGDTKTLVEENSISGNNPNAEQNEMGETVCSEMFQNTK